MPVRLEPHPKSRGLLFHGMSSDGSHLPGGIPESRQDKLGQDRMLRKGPSQCSDHSGFELSALTPPGALIPLDALNTTGVL